MKGPMIPFLIRPITRAVANKIEEAYVTRNFETHFSFIEDQLATSPNGGNYLCGPNLTGAVSRISQIDKIATQHGIRTF